MMVNALMGFATDTLFSTTLTLAGSVSDYNIRTAALAAGWDGVTPLVANVIVNAGAVVSASSTGTYAIDTDATFPSGSSIAITINGTVHGKGGVGSAPYNSGGSGGPAMRLRSSCAWSVVVGAAGIVVGGGGSGGGGAGKHDASGDAYHAQTGGGSGNTAVVATTAGTFTNNGIVGGGGAGGTGGGGGASYTNGSSSGGGGGGGAGFGGAGIANTAYCPATHGNAGAATTPGTGGAGSDCGDGGGATGSTGGALGHGACLVGLAFVNSGSGIAGTTYGTQS